MSKHSPVNVQFLNVLFIAAHFPPCDEIGGSIRSEKFIKYLSAFRWKATVVAMGDCDMPSENLDDYHEIVRLKYLTPYKKPYEVTAYGWAVRLWSALKNKRDYDIIYVSCPPFPQIITSVLLKKRTGKPLVLDFRDAWSLDPYQEGSLLKKIIYKYIFPRIEKWAFLYTDGIVLNTPSTLAAYKKKYPEYAPKMHLITNGYDEKEFSTVECESTIRREYMSILYCGRFGVGGRNFENLLNGLQLISRELKVKLELFGTQPEGFNKSIQEKGLIDMVLHNEQVPHQIVLQEMYRHDVLLLYQEASASEVQPIAGKTFEYLRVGKPILSIAPVGDNQNLVKQYSKIHEIVEDGDPENIAIAVRNLYSKWCNGDLMQTHYPKNDFEENFERKHLTKKLCEVFDGVPK